MKAFVLGGYGKTGLPAIRLLAQNDIVTEIAVAGRNLERAEQAAGEAGEKAIAIRADGTDAEALASLSAGYDIIINAATNDLVVPAIRAAIANRAHYCDMSWGDAVEPVLSLAPDAKDAGITAILATGISPCITNLMAVRAAEHLDQVEQLQCGRAETINFENGHDLSPGQWLEDPQQSLIAVREVRAHLGWGLQRLRDDGTAKLRTFRQGHWEEIDPIAEGLDVPAAQGGTTTAYPYLSGVDFWGMLPRDLTEAAPVEIWFSPLPPHLHALLRDQALRVVEGRADPEAAMGAFFEAVEGDPDHWLTIEDDFVPVAKVWVRAVGCKAGRAAQHTCWFTGPMWDVNGYYLTSVALVVAVLKILRGDVSERGVMPAEKAFDPEAFFDGVVALLPELGPDGRLIDEAFDWLG